MTVRRAGMAAGMAALTALGLGEAGHAASWPEAATGPLRLTLAVGEREPKAGRTDPGAERLAELEQRVVDAAQDRQRRLDLVQGLQASNRTQDALAAAREWRQHDAYNLVVVRLIGDLYAELGDMANARRTYSAVAELLPSDVGAQRALATVLKQGGDLEAAHARLVACTRLAPDDRRIAFELADTAQRLGRNQEAAERLQSIADDGATPDALRYPARQRLAQIWAADRRTALVAGDHSEALRLDAAIAALRVNGGAQNDIKVYLTWDTDRSDVDLWVVTPSGEKVFYSHKLGGHGEALFDDVTTGYGPESFTATHAVPGTYTVQVNYYAPRSGPFSEARGEVTVVLNEGRDGEFRQVLPYRLFSAGQTVSVARIQVR